MRSLLMTLLLITAAGAFDENSRILQEQSEQIRLGMRVVNALNTGRAERLPRFFQAGFDESSLKQSLASLWNTQKLVYGDFREARGAVAVTEDYHPVVYIRLDFEKAQRGLRLQLLMQKPWKIQTLEMVDPAKIPSGVRPSRSYVDADRYSVLPVEVGGSQAGLRGHLYWPKEVEHPEIVLFIHDFGAQNRTHRTGLNDVFLDIAEGLASSKKAALLIPRRSYIYDPPETMPFTPQWEVVNDVLASLHALRNQGWLKPESEVYLAGYGYGSWFLPWFASRDLFDGLIFLNPSFRHPLTILFERMEYRRANEPGAFKELLDLSRNVDDFFQGKLPRDQKLFGYPVSYFEALELYRPRPLTKDLEVLMLFARKDYVQNPADEPEFMRILKKASVVRHDFEELNRAFQRGSGNPAEDNWTPGVVSARVIHSMVDFLNRP